MKAIQILIILAVIGLAALASIIFWPGFVSRGAQKSTPSAPEPQVGNPETSTLPVAEGKPVLVGPVKLLVFGDLLLDRYIKRAIDNNDRDYPLINIKEFLAGHDLVLANLEGSFTDYSPKPLDPNNTSFTFDPSLVSLLFDYGFNVVNLANNHVRDFGAEGFIRSQDYLNRGGVAHFGDYYNEEPPLIENINGLKIAFVAYNEFGDASVDKTVSKIKTVRPNADRVVVYTHWGNEYQTAFSALQQERARQLIDAGADVVLGSHPHVIQPLEIYNGRPIFYSLGNFLFDQIFSEDVTHGLAVDITFSKDSTEYNLYITEMNKMQVGLADSETSQKLLGGLSRDSIVVEGIKQQMKFGKFTLAP